MLKQHTPGDIAPPFSPYSHGIEVPPDARWLYVSGQIGVDADGNIPDDMVEQNRLAWGNIRAILKSAGMDISDVVRINAFVTSTEGIAAYREVRTEAVGAARPASTLLVVAGLASPDFKVEIEVVAAKA